MERSFEVHRAASRYAWTVALVVVTCACAMAQTAVINEVSNGPSGTKEYIELLVIDTSQTAACTPGCLDLRGWLIDDNNGYHGAGGVAQGAARFANNALWSCVPAGTLILIYNNADPNPDLPPDDVSLADGNCTLVVSLNDLTYFEFTNTTPAALPCDYPAGGWGADPTPSWSSNTALANTGDCARLADPSGCERSSVCYGNVSQNPMIFFAGTGTDHVWYFNSGDPWSQVNWTEGCAGGGCGSDDQTPGAPNNAANAAYIDQFSNGCQPYVPLVAYAAGNAGCGCTGSATASADGSLPPYQYAWYDGAWNDIGQHTAVATGLCPGTYAAIVTSSSGCVDTAFVTLDAPAQANAGVDADTTLCLFDPPLDLFAVLAGGPDAGGHWEPPLVSGTGVFDPAQDAAGPHTYIVDGAGLCADTSVVTVIVNTQVADATIQPVGPLCSTAAPITLQAATSGGTWSGTGITDAQAGTFDPGTAGAGSIQVIYTLAGACGNADTVFVEVDAPADATITPPPVLCENDAPIQLTAATIGGTWSGPGITDAQAGTFDPTAAGVGDATVHYDIGGTCPGQGTAVVTVLPHVVPLIDPAGPFCTNDAPLVLTADLPGGQWSGAGITGPSTGAFDPAQATSPAMIIYTLSGACAGADTLVIALNEPPGAAIALSTTSGCAPLDVTIQDIDFQAGTQYQWDLGDGSTYAGGASFLHTYAATGCYPITLTATGANGCSATYDAPSLVCATPPPTADFVQHTAASDADDGCVLLINTSINATAQQWWIDGSAAGLSTDLQHCFGSGPEGDHEICLVASNGAGCADTICRTVTPPGPLLLFVPNSFTPNGDGINDVFHPTFTGAPPPDLVWRVFDRWGQVIYSSNDANAAWDGTIGGRPAEVSVYIWQVSFHQVYGGLESPQRGHVTLVR